MVFQLRRQRRAIEACIALSLLLVSLPAWAAEKTRLHVDDYQISVELTPHAHKMSAHATVKFTALDDLNIATFNLHNDLRVTKVTDATGKTLSAERVTQDSSVRVPLNEATYQRQFDDVNLRIRRHARLARREPGAGAKTRLYRR